jgi:hypothetical protein
VELETRVVRIERDALNARQWQLQTEGADDARHVYSGFDAVLLAIWLILALGMRVPPVKNA